MGHDTSGKQHNNCPGQKSGIRCQNSKGGTQYDALLEAKEVENFLNSLLDHS